MRGEEERGRESCRRKKGGRRGESKEQRKRKKKEEETVREGERERRSLCLLCSGGGSEMLPNEVRFSSMVSCQPHCPAEAPLGLMRDSGAWRLPITELSLF